MCFADVKLKPDGKNFSTHCAFSLSKRISGHLHILLRPQLKLGSDDKTDWCIQRTESSC